MRKGFAMYRFRTEVWVHVGLLVRRVELREQLMNDSPLDLPDIQTRILKQVLQVQSAWQEWCANPTEEGFSDKLVETLVATLDAHAQGYLSAVNSRGLLSEYSVRLRSTGRALIENAEHRSLLADPYSEERLRKIAESSSNYISKRGSLTPEQQEQRLQAEIERTRMALRNQAVERQVWKTDMLFRIETQFEARHAHWMAKAMEQVECVAAQGAHNSEPGQAAVTTSSEQSLEPAATPGKSTRYPHTDLQVTDWDQIEIFFLSEERVQIRVDEQRETCNYGELGFADGRHQKPKLAWETLRRLAESGGTLATDPHWSTVEKRMQEIRTLLRRYFGLRSDPLPLVPETGYQTRFKIRCAPSYNS